MPKKSDRSEAEQAYSALSDANLASQQMAILGEGYESSDQFGAGKYLVVVRGTDNVVRQATRILRQFDPENLQGYVEPVEG